MARVKRDAYENFKQPVKRKSAYEVPYLEKKAVTKAKQLPHLKRSDPVVKSDIKYKVDTYQTPEEKATAARLKRQQLESTSRREWVDWSAGRQKITKRQMKNPTRKSVRFEK